MTARAFLQAVEARYRALEHYVDRGFTQSAKRGLQSRCDFKTDFDKEGTFRFAFWRGHPYRPLRHLVSHYEIGQEGGNPYFLTQYPDEDEVRESCESLELAIAGATGISSGSAFTIGSLLFNDIGGLQFADLKRPRFRGMRMVDGTLCVAVSARHPNGGRFLLCFGAQDLLLRAKFMKFGHRSLEHRTIDKAVFTSASSGPRGTAA